MVLNIFAGFMLAAFEISVKSFTIVYMGYDVMNTNKHCITGM